MKPVSAVPTALAWLARRLSLECFILPAAGRTINLVGFIFLHSHSDLGINHLLCFSSKDYQLE